MKRRKFIKAACTLGGISVAIALVEGCSKTEVNPKPAENFSIDLTNSANSALLTTGGVVFQQGVFVVKTSTGYLALSQVCTHAGCSVAYTSASKQFKCPCHGGIYNINGGVVSGPPPAPLAQYKVTISGNILTVSS